MKNIAIILVAFCIATTTCLQFVNLRAQEKSGQSTEKADRPKEKKKGLPGDKSGRSEEKTKKKGAEKGGLRLPRFFGILVDESQREKILSIRAKHQAKIEDLRKQLAALEQQEMDEMENVLTPAQRKQLESLRSEDGKADPPKDKGKSKEKK